MSIFQQFLMHRNIVAYEVSVICCLLLSRNIIIWYFGSPYCLLCCSQNICQNEICENSSMCAA